MSQNASVAELLGRGVKLKPHEAVAIAQQLIQTLALGVDTTPPLGPPCPENVLLGRDGTVQCRGCAITPTVFEIGVLLDAMLRRSGPMPMPGGLRYMIARALLDVDVLPFVSLSQLSTALQRYERGDRASVVRDLLERADGSVVAAPARAQSREAIAR